jgi:putative membrane protein
MLIKGSLKGILSGALVGTLPAVGSSQAAVLSHQLSRRKGSDDREFLVSLGAVNTIVAMFSLISLYTISKARSGAAIAVQQLLPAFELPQLLVLASVTLAAAGISSLLLLKSTRHMVGFIQKINYRKATVLVIVSLVALTFWFTGPFGLLVLFTATSIGMLPPLLGVKRTFGMGVLMLPVILFYAL